jgi:hypothetical protein
MTASEIDAAFARYMNRVAEILTPDERTRYAAYMRRLEATIARSDPNPVDVPPAEQAVLDKIAADTEAMALRKQYSVLIGLEKLPQ